MGLKGTRIPFSIAGRNAPSGAYMACLCMVCACAHVRKRQAHRQSKRLKREMERELLVERQVVHVYRQHIHVHVAEIGAWAPHIVPTLFTHTTIHKDMSGRGYQQQQWQNKQQREQSLAHTLE